MYDAKVLEPELGAVRMLASAGATCPGAMMPSPQHAAWRAALRRYVRASARANRPGLPWRDDLAGDEVHDCAVDALGQAMRLPAPDTAGAVWKLDVLIGELERSGGG